MSAANETILHIHLNKHRCHHATPLFLSNVSKKALPYFLFESNILTRKDDRLQFNFLENFVTDNKDLSIKLYKKRDEESAKKLMLNSVFYITMLQVIYVLDKFLFN